MRKDCIFLIFGVTGDLAKKKIIPALYELFSEGFFNNVIIIGIARRKFSSKKILNDSKKYMKDFKKRNFNKLLKRFHYFQLNFNDSDRYNELQKFVIENQRKYKIANKINYLSTSPEYFEIIVKNLKKSEASKKKGFNRIVFEKPFGFDYDSAKKIDNRIRKVFNEKEIFRIDHYLGKEIVKNIITLRFDNQIFRSIWNRDNIAHIQIILAENQGIGRRGEFYDKYGAIKDVVQNHIVQLLALTLMNPPKKLDENYIRNEKIKILKKIKIEKVVLGQYKNYKNEKNVKKNSKTETFAALKVFVNLKKWRGIPIYILTGKKLKKKITHIYIEFKKSSCYILEEECNFEPNYLDLEIQPDEGFYLALNARDSFKEKTVPIVMEFCHKCKFGPNTPDAYKNLFKEIIKGNQLLFIRSDEIKQEWKIINQIEKKHLKVYVYNKRNIPDRAEDLIKNDGYDWHLEINKK